VISVAAIDPNDDRPSFSHYGRKYLDNGAPGVGIVSTIQDGRYARLDGTSMAAPHVAGAAALVWARAFSSPAQDRMQMTRVRDLICEHARPVPELKELWGQTARARVPGGVLDLSFLAAGSGSRVTPGRKSFEFRVKVDPAKLR
jgi:thermitase